MTWVVPRSKGLRLKHPAKVVIATSSAPRDDAVARWGSAQGVAVFRGSEHDVLERYQQCASSFGLQHIVRLTADNPFVDVEEIDRLIDRHLQSQADYTSSIRALPEGIGAEMFTYDALLKSHANGHERHHREHVNEYILENRKQFAVVEITVPASKNGPDVRLTVDTADDYRRACHIAETVSTPFVGTAEAIAIFRQLKRSTPSPFPMEAFSA